MKEVEVGEYELPCGEKFFTYSSVGYAHGICIAVKEGEHYNYNNECCKKCTLGCAHKHTISCYDEETRKIQPKDIVTCVGYAKDYLEKKDRETISELDTDDVGKYVIEIIIQQGEFRSIVYTQGCSHNVGLLSLIDSGSLMTLFGKDYDEDLGMYSLWMTSTKTGESTTVEFEHIDDIIAGIVSVRFLEQEK